MKWQNKNGDIIDFSDMSFNHLRNARKYILEHKPYQWELSSELLEKEIKKRKKEEFLAITEVCPWCFGIMRTKEIIIESDPDEGVGMGWRKTEYFMFCEKCNARSPKLDLPSFSVE